MNNLYLKKNTIKIHTANTKNHIQYLKCILTQAALGSETGNIYKGLLYSAWLSGWWCHCL